VNVNTESVDNYLKAILNLGGPEERRVSSTALASFLGVAPASVTNMLQKLASPPSSLVEYERHRGVLLSPTGKRRAIEIVRHHRLIETFLYEVLDYPIEEIHEEAERLEHFISERLEERIAAKLGYPKFDPHGHFIPAMDGKIPRQRLQLLRDGSERTTYVVDSIADQDAAVLKALRSQGIAPGVRLTLIARDLEGKLSLKLERSGRTFCLDAAFAGAISIRPEPEREERIKRRTPARSVHIANDN